jgi:hypothetical protein
MGLLEGAQGELLMQTEPEEQGNDQRQQCQ